MKQKIYIATEDDECEIPIYIEDSAESLAKKLLVHSGSIMNCARYNNRITEKDVKVRTIRGCRIFSVYID